MTHHSPQPISIDWDSLESKYNQYKEENPSARSRDISNTLSVPEASFFEAQLGVKSQRLDSKPMEMFPEMPKLGKIMSIVRNENAVHERKGVFQQIMVHEKPMMATVLGSDIDQRVFFRTWGSAYSFEMEGRRGTLEGLAFFDIHGNALMKLYKQDETDEAGWNAFIEKYKLENAEKPTYYQAPQPEKYTTADMSSIDKDNFVNEWSQLKDTHDFFMFLKKHNVCRTDALRLAEGKFAFKQQNSLTNDLLARVSSAGMPFMVFVGNPGIIQIHDGVINKTFEQSGWLNIMDPEFNLHLNLEGVQETWHVVKPTVDGDVNSVELYDKDGELIVTFFSSRKPGTPEREIWREILEEVTNAVSA
ncbi:MAG: hemin-degrading factor [Candidatus Kapaibacteriales bacterium]